MSGIGAGTWRRRSIWNWAIGLFLLVSVIANLGLVARSVLFDMNHRFKPICFVQADGLVALDGLMSEKFRDKVVLSDISARAGGLYAVFVSRWDWWNRREEYWNLTRRIAERMHQERAGERVTKAVRARLRTGSCGFIRKYALDKVPRSAR